LREKRACLHSQALSSIDYQCIAIELPTIAESPFRQRRLLICSAGPISTFALSDLSTTGEKPHQTAWLPCIFPLKTHHSPPLPTGTACHGRQIVFQSSVKKTAWFLAFGLNEGTKFTNVVRICHECRGTLLKLFMHKNSVGNASCLVDALSAGPDTTNIFFGRRQATYFSFKKVIRVTSKKR
jgi:hypothetical protein